LGLETHWPDFEEHKTAAVRPEGLCNYCSS